MVVPAAIAERNLSETPWLHNFSRCQFSAKFTATNVFFFFFSAPFSRRRSLVDDCFTGQSPGSATSIPAAPDVHEGLGQIQASAP